MAFLTGIIRALFDGMVYELLLRAVRKYTQRQWMPLYIERWLKGAGAIGGWAAKEQWHVARRVISPLLENLFLHYAFYKWMQRNRPDKPFERYADDEIPWAARPGRRVVMRSVLNVCVMLGFNG